ncbi:MAG TPA: tripartite tricarboxylate transporter substrate binding protein [Xanthobacteraceae bacterium]
MLLRSWRLTAAAALILGSPCPSLAQTAAEDPVNYPSQPIHIVVPASPGGVNDIMARLVGQKLTERLGQPVVVDNKPGAATILGTDYVARARPDGYTLLSAPMASIAVNPAVYPKLPYAPQRDFVPISLAASYPYLLAVSNAAPVGSVRELIDYTKAHADKSNAGGASTTFQLATELFKQRTGAQIQYVPFKGSNDAIMALISGQLLLSFVDSGPALPQIKSGQFRVLAVTSPARMPSLPDLPTMAEAGIPGMEVVSWSGFLAPAGTPPAIATRLQNAIRKILQDDEIRDRLQALELEPVGSTSEEFGRTIAKDIEKWSAVAKAANVKAE